MKIYKYPLKRFGYPLPPDAIVEVEMPTNAIFLSLQMQYEVPVIWAYVDERAPLEKRRFQIIPTGSETIIPLNNKFLGTFQLEDGFVGHVFDVTGN